MVEKRNITKDSIKNDAKKKNPDIDRAYSCSLHSRSCYVGIQRDKDKGKNTKHKRVVAPRLKDMPMKEAVEGAQTPAARAIDVKHGANRAGRQPCCAGVDESDAYQPQHKQERRNASDHPPAAAAITTNIM